MVLLEQGKPTEALTSFNRALEIHPNHESALLNSAILLQELGRPEFRLIARDRLLTLLDKDRRFLSYAEDVETDLLIFRWFR